MAVQIDIHSLGLSAITNISALWSLLISLSTGWTTYSTRYRGIRATILWQQLQLEHIGTLLQDLLAKNLIGYFFEIEEAESFLRSHREAGCSTPKFTTRLYIITEIWDLTSPHFDDGFIDVSFYDGVSWLMGTLSCNQILFPSMFDMELIEPVILDFLRKEVMGLIKSSCGHSYSKP